MTVTVHLPSMLRSLADGSGNLDIAGETLADALDAVAASYPMLERRLRDETGALRRYVNFYVDGEECRRLSGAATPLADGGDVVIIPSVAGG